MLSTTEKRKRKYLVPFALDPFIILVIKNLAFLNLQFFFLSFPLPTSNLYYSKETALEEFQAWIFLESILLQYILLIMSQVQKLTLFSVSVQKNQSRFEWGPIWNLNWFLCTDSDNAKKVTFKLGSSLSILFFEFSDQIASN